jgi:hypothetical protein
MVRPFHLKLGQSKVLGDTNCPEHTVSCDVFVDHLSVAQTLDDIYILEVSIGSIRGCAAHELSPCCVQAIGVRPSASFPLSAIRLNATIRPEGDRECSIGTALHEPPLDAVTARAAGLPIPAADQWVFAWRKGSASDND